MMTHEEIAEAVQREYGVAPDVAMRAVVRLHEATRFIGAKIGEPAVASYLRAVAEYLP